MRFAIFLGPIKCHHGCKLFCVFQDNYNPLASIVPLFRRIPTLASYPVSFSGEIWGCRHHLQLLIYFFTEHNFVHQPILCRWHQQPTQEKLTKTTKPIAVCSSQFQTSQQTFPRKREHLSIWYGICFCVDSTHELLVICWRCGQMPSFLRHITTRTNQTSPSHQSSCYEHLFRFWRVCSSNVLTERGTIGFGCSGSGFGGCCEEMGRINVTRWSHWSIQ